MNIAVAVSLIAIAFIMGFILGAVGSSSARQSHQIDDIQDKLDWIYEHAECAHSQRHA